LVTPISIASADSGKKVLCVSALKAREGSGTVTDDYTRIVSEKVGQFDLIFKDSDPAFIVFSQHILATKIALSVQKSKILACDCGAYEELEGVRMFDLHRVKGGVCLRCQSKLSVREEDMLMGDFSWPTTGSFSCNLPWAQKDLEHFLGRQISRQKISKKIEPISIVRDGLSFGIRLQLLWAIALLYISETESDTELTVHYVDQARDRVFYVCSVAKMINPNIQIYLKALPAVWMDESCPIIQCTPSRVKLLQRALNTKKKEVKVSLKSWR
jgi:hypothetical protein